MIRNSSRTIHSFAHSRFSSLCDQARVVKLRDQIVQVVVGFENDVAAATTIAAARPAFRDKRFAMEGHAPFATMAGSRKNFDFVDKHENKKGEVDDLAVKSFKGT